VGLGGDKEEVEPDVGERGSVTEAAARLEVATGPWSNVGGG
jgi:hypothetical protein